MNRAKYKIPVSGQVRSGMLCLLIVMLFMVTEAKAQSSGTSHLAFDVMIPEIALIDIEPAGNTNFTIHVNPATEAGEKPGTVGSAPNSDLWLNYTNSRTTNGPFRKVIVQVSGTIPLGTSLKLQASPRSATCGSGLFGIPAGTITLSNAPQVLISNIGGSYTGDGIGCGHRLNFTFQIDEFELIQYAQSTTLQVIYTLADN